MLRTEHKDFPLISSQMRRLEEIPRRKINAKQVTIIQNFETFEKPKEKWQKDKQWSRWHKTDNLRLSNTNYAEKTRVNSGALGGQEVPAQLVKPVVMHIISHYWYNILIK